MRWRRWPPRWALLWREGTGPVGLTLEAMFAPMIAAQTVGQLAAGVEFSTTEVIGPITGFVVLAGVAAWFLIAIARHIAEEAP